MEEDKDGQDEKNIDNQVITVGDHANDVSIYTNSDGMNNSMLTRMRRVFREQPVVFHHAITNDNVSDIEISLAIDSLYLRRMKTISVKGSYE